MSNLVATACPKCNGLGVECYYDDEDQDYHLRACDCPTGIETKKRVEGGRIPPTETAEKKP